MDPKLFTLVLHSHIPYVVGHGTWPHGMDWLYEAVAESYLPLLGVFRRLADQGLSPRVTIGFTPVLAEQLRTPGFVEGFGAYLQMKLDVARHDQEHFQRTGEAMLASLAVRWRTWYEGIAVQFLEESRGDIIGGFKALQDEGHIEILTSAATHAYFPLLSRDESISRQVRQGRLTYRKHFGREAEGFWLPECAFRPGYAWTPPLGPPRTADRKGLDVLLGEEGLDHFFIPAHLLQGGTARGVYEERFPALRSLWDKAYRREVVTGQHVRSAQSPYGAYRAEPSALSFLARDDISGRQVWSRDMGYPGDGAYLEFHKKHFPGGLRYWRVTSPGADLALKAPYDPEKIGETLESHASHFVELLNETLRDEGRTVVTALFDTELFGHWWFEGPEWLSLVLRKLDQGPVRAVTSGQCLKKLVPRESVSLSEGSWGEGGFHAVWLNKDTAWIWEKVYEIEERTARLDRKVTGRAPRLAKQLMREKFLLESSDWPFLISTGTARDYAEHRAAEHFDRARTLADWLQKPDSLSPSDEALLTAWEGEDGLFSEVVGVEGETLA